MNKLPKLPDVSLLVVETRMHDISRMTIVKLLEKVEPKDIWIYTDKPEKFGIDGANYVTVADWPTKYEMACFFQYESWKPVATSHVLFLEWDAGLCNVDMWRDEFLQYDYIGAPWWWMKDGKPDEQINVGNGGFSLRSMRLMEAVGQARQTNPEVDTHSDWELCRGGRPFFENLGFKWAPTIVANDFAVEEFDRCGLPNNDRHFGFHNVVPGWPLVLDREELIARYRILKAHPYTATGWGQGGHRQGLSKLLGAAPWLRTAV